MATRTSGTLVVIGGHEDRRGDRVILRRFVDLAGGADARIVLIGTATTLPEEVATDYKTAFDGLTDDVTFLALGTREEANDASLIAPIEHATGIFFTGGDQMRIATILGGSKTDLLVHRAFEHGAVLAGTSAGAAMMSASMILRGSDTVPATGVVELGPGLEFVTGLLIDMHFAERGRLARLLAAVAQFPHELGVGIDEDTALLIDGNRCEVIGAGAATIVDAGQATSEETPRGTIGLTNVRLHVLPAGFAFDLSTRQPAIIEVGDPD